MSPTIKELIKGMDVREWSLNLRDKIICEGTIIVEYKGPLTPSSKDIVHVVDRAYATKLEQMLELAIEQRDTLVHDWYSDIESDCELHRNDLNQDLQKIARGES